MIRVGDYEDHSTIRNTIRNVKHILSDGHYEIMENSTIVIEFDHVAGVIHNIVIHKKRSEKNVRK